MPRKHFIDKEKIGILQQQVDLKDRYDKNLKKKDPLSFMNISELCYGKKVIEQYRAKNN